MAWKGRCGTNDVLVVILMLAFYADFLSVVVGVGTGLIAISLSLTVWLIKGLAEGRYDVPYSSAYVLLVLMVAAAFFAMIAPIGSPFSKLARTVAFCYIRLGMVFLVISLIRGRDQLQRAAYGFIGLGVVSAVVALWQFWTFVLTGVNYSFGEGENLYRATAQGLLLRASGLGKNPNEIGPTMAVAAIICLYLGISRVAITRGARVAHYLAFGVLVGGVLVTFSRAATLGLLSVCLAVPFIRRPAWRWRIAALYGVLAVGLAVAGAIGVFEILGDPTEAISIRYDLDRLGLRAIMEYPITGVGIDAFPYYDNAYDEAVHNLLIQVASEMGIPGLFFFIVLLADAGVKLVRVTWRAKDEGARSLFGGVAMGYAAQILTHFGNPTLSDLAFWFFLGVAEAAVVLGASGAEASKDGPRSSGQPPVGGWA